MIYLLTLQFNIYISSFSRRKLSNSFLNQIDLENLLNKDATLKAKDSQAKKQLVENVLSNAVDFQT